MNISATGKGRKCMAFILGLRSRGVDPIGVVDPIIWFSRRFDKKLSEDGEFHASDWADTQAVEEFIGQGLAG